MAKLSKAKRRLILDVERAIIRKDSETKHIKEAEQLRNQSPK